MSKGGRQALTNALLPIGRGIYRLFGGFHASGQEHIPASGGVILAPNHRSWADPPAVRLSVRRDCWFMANDFLFRIPFVGWFIRTFGAFPVKRGAMDRDAIRHAENYLKEGDLVCMFPEGGTTITGTLYPFEGGVALIAIRNNVPIVPVAIVGSDNILPADKFIPRYARGGVTVKFGPPIYPAEIAPELPRRERIDHVTQLLYERVAALLPEEYVPAEYRYLCGHPELASAQPKTPEPQPS